MGALDPEGSLTLADVTGDLASGFDTIQNNYADVLNDPTQEFLNYFILSILLYTVFSPTQTRTVTRTETRTETRTISFSKTLKVKC